MTSQGATVAVAEHALPADVRRAYLDQVAISYSFYVVGAATAFVAVALALSETEAGLHSSAMALGMITAGLFGERFDRLAGARRAHLAALGLLALALLVLAWAPTLLATLLASGSIGLGAGSMFGHVNQALGAGGGARARLQLTRSALIAKASQLMVPVAIGAGIAIGVGWQLVIVPVLALIGLLFVATRARLDGSAGRTMSLGRLPWAYWLPWSLVVAVIAIEFFVVVWGGPLVERQTGVPLADATLTISAFIGGLILGRAVMSTRAMSRLDPIAVLRAGIGLTFAAVLLPWSTTSYEVSVVGMLLAGFGVGILYPPSASITLAAAPDQPAAAAARLVSAAGLAILVAPLLLGMIADVTEIATAWVLVPTLCVVTLLLTVPVARAHGRRGG